MQTYRKEIYSFFHFGLQLSLTANILHRFPPSPPLITTRNEVDAIIKKLKQKITPGPLLTCIRFFGLFYRYNMSHEDYFGYPQEPPEEEPYMILDNFGIRRFGGT